MKRLTISALVSFLCLLLSLTGQALAVGPDDYIGDTSIYGGETAAVKPNLLIIFDTSGSMKNSVNIKTCYPDADSDGEPDKSDNCPNDANGPDAGPNDQRDSDHDGVGDVCDNCPNVANQDQVDVDNDGIGDACDAAIILPTDPDLDGKFGTDDNCPYDWNPPQKDTDLDGWGDVCDNCPNDANANQADRDNDGIGDACDEDSGIYYDPTLDPHYTQGTYCGEYTPETTTQDCRWINHHKVCSDPVTVPAGYTETCHTNSVYYCWSNDWDTALGFCSNWQEIKTNVDDLNDQCGNVNGVDVPDGTVEAALKSEGRWDGYVRFKDNSGSKCKKTDELRHFRTGDYLNYYNSMVIVQNQISPIEQPVDLFARSIPTAAATSAVSGEVCITEKARKNTMALQVLKTLVTTTTGVNIGVMRFNSSNQGGNFVTATVDGVPYTTTIKDMDANHTATMTNREALVSLIQEDLDALSNNTDHYTPNLPADGYTPLAETLYEASRYYEGLAPVYNTQSAPIIADGKYVSPITAECQMNYVVVITDGASTKDIDSHLTDICAGGDCDRDGHDLNNDGTIKAIGGDDGSDMLDDVAKYLNGGGFNYNGSENVITYTIGFDISSDSTAVQLLEDTAFNGTGKTGNAFLATNIKDLTSAFDTILGQISEVTSAFVAPVVPTSPENRTYSGKRVYLGFFKPIKNKGWKGNLKKYGLDGNGDIVDKNGNVATDSTGNFYETSVSFWSSAGDGGEVESGGIGELLATRDQTTSPRKIYTYLSGASADADLTASRNAVEISNTDLTTALLGGVTTTARTDIINYLHGLDSYDYDTDYDYTEKRSWLLGDILHSRPLIQSYNSFVMADEGDPTKNKTVIYAGTNEGTLHAFRDANGEEIWSFVPPIFLDRLQLLGNTVHEYYVDGSPVPYVEDVNHDGVPEKVLLFFGTRRGAGIDRLDPSLNRGAYYALDVTNPEAPKFLWELKGTTTGFGELGESWSDPVIGKVRITQSGSLVTKLVAIIGAGYDNNDDLRFGATQTYPDDTDAVDTDTSFRTDESGNVTSSGTATSGVNPKGRGIYVIDLGTLNNGALTANTSPTLLWGMTYGATDTASASLRTSTQMTYAFPTTVKAIDTDYDGYLDTVYAGDTGGNMWRFSIGNRTSTANWTGNKIFSSNPSDALVSGESPVTNGRRILSPPSVILQPGYTTVFFGTGDRAHPLNESGVDRIYAVHDRGQNSTKTEVNLVNVTENYLQADSNPTPDPGTCTPGNTSNKCQLQYLYDPSYYGWFIKLNEHVGEKVLSPPIVFSGAAYFTTFTPQFDGSDPCAAGNLGQGRVYVLNYQTGEAVVNYDASNDYDPNDPSAAPTNQRALLKGTPGVALRRTDRVLNVESGIPSGAVIILNEDGSSDGVLGSGDGVIKVHTLESTKTKPVYWLME